METQNSKQIPRAYVAMVPTPGIGHLIPLVELAKRLVHQYNFLVTIFVPTIDDGTGSSIQTIRQVLESLPTSISTIFLPPVSFDDLPDDFLIETRITLTLVRSLSSLRDALKVLAESTRLVALVVDPFGSAAFDVANEVGVPAYVFFTTTAMALSFLFHLPELDVKFSCEYRDMPEPVQLPGCVPVHGRDFADGFQQRKNEAYRFLLSFSKQYLLAAGIMVNSFMELETGPFKALMEGESSFKPPPVYPVGPLIQTGSNNETNNDRSLECLKWLDEQPSESVLFVCFGSGGTLSQEQLNELALGLEMREEGKLLRKKMRALKDAAANALSPDGSSTKSLAQLARIWKNPEFETK
ncbi:UDP-glycosyltransferase 72B1 [Citrus sinensis]|uniref:UDP-glycosyltransferase 72B1 n=1 Tax=Citrus sinensis TaxID=2711 RepID=A0ACB8JNZ6_CITSI|nr:UDP-glycosyltransferase 72B1 [Citrus sinensis]